MALTTDHGYVSYTLPTPVEVPLRTPARGLSRRSSRYESSSPAISSSPPPLPVTGEDSYFFGKQHNDVTIDEKSSMLDLRRFTPTLHASLVSEILSLRREVESKNHVVGVLEESLQSAKNETDRLHETIASNAKEHRSMKLQIETLEAGTLSALEELAKERDRTAENLSDTRRRLEVSQKKVRTQEEEAKRTHGIWDRDRQGWASEKRLLDRRVHAAEERVKLIIAEFAAARENEQNRRDAEKFADWRKEDHGSRSETSMSSRTLYGRASSDGRTSSMSGRYGLSAKVAGVSLAEELGFEEDEEDIEDIDYVIECASPGELPEEAAQRMRPSSAQSHHQSSKAMRLLGLFKDDQGSLLDEEPMEMTDASRHAAVKIMDTVQEVSPAHCQYIDKSTQFSPPTSPRLSAQQTRDNIPDPALAQSGPIPNEESIPFIHQDSKPTLIRIALAPMVSQACQTLEQPLSPPDTPKTCDASTFVMDDIADPVDSFTQTDSCNLEVTSPAITRDTQIPSLEVPVIAIHPPITGSTSERHSVVLPPQTKNAICQASISLPIALRSVSVQTEEIRIDRRPIKLPPHLLPSAISSQPPSPSPDIQKAKTPSIGEAPRRKAPAPPIPKESSNANRLSDTEAANKTRDNYPGRNDDGPLNASNESGIKRPIRSGSLFAGFDEAHDPIATAIAETDFSDDDFVNAEPIRKTLSKVQNSWKLVPQTNDSVLDRLESHKLTRSVTAPSELESLGSLPKVNKEDHSIAPAAKSGKLSRSVAESKKENIRKAALISNGIAVHTRRGRSPSAPNTSKHTVADVPMPPFPVPMRLSSKKNSVSSSDGARSPTPKSTRLASGRGGKENGRLHDNRPVLRKVRSEMTPKSRNGRSPSPPLMSPSFSIPESPLLPPLLEKEATSRATLTHQRPIHSQKTSYSSACMEDVTLPEAVVPQTSVVDAIAQTMVGEWMWKYVRRRKSFGIPESPQAEFESGKNSGDNGSRHKRWVWLAPYDCAIMWSTKQPISGPALLGKSGRKRMYRSSMSATSANPTQLQFNLYWM